MGKLLLLSLVLFSCATAKPRGQVVRLDTQSKTEIVESKPLELNFAQEKTPPRPEEAAVYHFTMGNAYSLDNDTERAIESYRATLVHDPKSALVRARLAAELVKINSFAEAKQLCEEAISLDPNYVDSYLLLAGIQVAAKELDGAILTYEKALKVDPTNRDALLYDGVTLAEVGKVKQGVAQLEKLVRLKDNTESTIDRSVAYYYLAKVYQQSAQREKAIGALKQALKVRPGFARAALLLADLYAETKQQNAAFAILEEAFRENHSSELAERLSEMHLEKNNYKKAVIYLETLVEEDPTNENLKLRLSLVYWQLQWFDKARLVLQGLLERYPSSSEIAFYLGELEMERKEFSNALVYYKKISPDYPKFDQMVSRVVFLYRQQNQLKAAEEFLHKSLEQKPDAVGFYPQLASLYEDQNQLADAAKILAKGNTLFPADESVLYYLGFIQDRMGEKEKALSTMEQLLKVNPDNTNALNFVGYGLLEKGGDLSKAQELLGRAVQLKPEDPFVLDSYGWLLYRLGKNKEAMKSLEKAVALKPEESVMLEHLGDIYIALNMPNKAIGVYERALRTGGDKEFISRVENKLDNVQSTFTAKARKPVPRKPLRVPASQP